MTGSVLLSSPEHCAAITYAVERLSDAATAAGLGAAVPTCPGWTVRDLVAHLGMVHRWATAHVTGDRAAQQEAATVEAEAQGREVEDPMAWLLHGADDLVTALRAAPADLEAFVFLKDAPAPREFWARRQCHETTIHAVDGLSAALGRAPTAEEARRTGVSAALALDGLDELLTGFVPRRSSRLRSEHPLRIAVRPNDAELAWLVDVGEDAPVTTRHTPSTLPEVDDTFSGTAVQLYLGLWNRGDEAGSGDVAVLQRWQELVRVSWR